jgi:hypothetical protein
MWSILFKTIVARFYRENAGIFLFFGYLFVGIVPPGQVLSYHLLLIKNIYSSTHLLLAVLFFWSCYFLKMLTFTFKKFSSHEYRFLIEMQGLSKSHQAGKILTMCFLMYEPILTYSIILVGFAIYDGYYLSAAIILSFQIIVHFFYFSMVSSRLNGFHQINQWAFWERIFNSLKIKTPAFLFLPFHLFREKRQAFLITKSLSFLLIYLFFNFHRESFGFMFFQISFLFVVICHALFPVYSMFFLEQNMKFLRNLPVSRVRIYSFYALTYFMLFLPEVILMAVVSGDLLNTTQIINLMIMSIGTLMFFTALLHASNFNQDKYFRNIFIYFVASYFLLFANVYMYIGLILAGSFSLFFINYYKLELSSE